MTDSGWHLPMGAEVLPDGVSFRVWAPAARAVEVEIHGPDGVAAYPLAGPTDGTFEGFVPGIGAGTLYKFRLDGGASYPDPYSRYQPQGVHGPSAVVDPAAYEWHDDGWQGLAPEGLVIYECHVGTYTPHGTFDALAEELPEIARVGVNAVQLMPVAEFPGRWNWGYDGVDLFAPTRAYGGPEGLKRLVDAAHRLGIGIILDVVYNHLGPDGNYLRAFSPTYFTDRYQTPWGEAFNYDGEGSWGMREYVVQNACYWLNEYHVDGLRLDATHAIFDSSPVHILRELATRARASLPPGRRVVLIAEDHNNDVRLIHPPEDGGYGMDIVYADDFHHEVRVTLTGEREGYYVDYVGGAERLAKAIKEGFLYQGEESAYFGRPRGTKTTQEPARQFLFFIQNHDQVGNRAFGDRLNHAVDSGHFAVASALLLLSPETPLIFMGQEFAASQPFLYFTDHEPGLGKLVTEGRRREFSRFSAFSDPNRRDQIPDPQAETTFRLSKLNLQERVRHGGAYRLYRDLLALRRRDPVFCRQDRENLRAAALAPNVLAIHRWHEQEHRLILANVGGAMAVAVEGEELLRDLPEDSRVLVWSSATPDYGTAPTAPPLGLRARDTLRLPAASVLILGPASAMFKR